MHLLQHDDGATKGRARWRRGQAYSIAGTQTLPFITLHNLHMAFKFTHRLLVRAHSLVLKIHTSWLAAAVYSVPLRLHFYSPLLPIPLPLLPRLQAFDLAPPGQAPPDGAITAAQRALDSATGFVQDNQRIVCVLRIHLCISLHISASHTPLNNFPSSHLSLILTPSHSPPLPSPPLRYGFVILLCCFVLIVVAVLVGALVCAILSHRRDALPWNRSKLSHCTAITLLM